MLRGTCCLMRHVLTTFLTLWFWSMPRTTDLLVFTWNLHSMTWVAKCPVVTDTSRCLTNIACLTYKAILQTTYVWQSTKFVLCLILQLPILPSPLSFLLWDLWKKNKCNSRKIGSCKTKHRNKFPNMRRLHDSLIMWDMLHKSDIEVHQRPLKRAFRVSKRNSHGYFAIHVKKCKCHAKVGEFVVIGLDQDQRVREVFCSCVFFAVM